MIPVHVAFEDATCDECGYKGIIVNSAPCPRCGARERRPPTAEEQHEAELALWTRPIMTADEPTRPPLVYIAKRQRTKKANQKRAERHRGLVGRAHELDRQGMSRRRIAEMLDVDVRTVYRLLEEQPCVTTVALRSYHDISSADEPPDLAGSGRPATLLPWPTEERSRQRGDGSAD